MSINSISRYLQHQYFEMKISMLTIGDEVTDTANATMACCLHSS